MRRSVTVAVIIPAYNAERYLVEAVRSALTQTLDDLSVVVVDDGSVDGTLALARAVDDPRVRVIASPNGGPAHARNLGWRSADPSPYVAFLDADDLWDVDKLRVQTAYLEQHADVLGVGSLMRYISSSGRILGQAGQSVGEADQARVARGELSPFPMSSLVVRRKALAAVGGFDGCFRYAGSEDLDLFARLAQRGRLACVPEPLGSYRIHPASAMARERVRINAEARFVRLRAAARALGGDLQWEDFARDYRPTWRERWQDRAELLYRGAALWLGEGRHVRGLAHLALAAAVAPRYTLVRLYRQRRGAA